MRRALAIALTTTAAFPAAAAGATTENVRQLPMSHLTDRLVTAQKRVAHHRRELARERRDRSVAMPAYLAAIAACESGNNPRAIGGGGQYRGLFQFDIGTWQAVGGHGDPAAASVAEQVKRAQILYAQSGPGQWPVCGA